MKKRYAIYKGPNAGQGEKHLILEYNNREVITWGERGYTWLGPLQLFHEQFDLLPE